MSRAQLVRLLDSGRRFTSPFLMLGDPTPDVSVRLGRALVDAGAGMLELGLPYADPSADGPAVQAAGRRARRAGVSTDGAFDVLRRVRRLCPDTPCNLLVYANLVHARGYDRFCRDAVDAGAASLLVPDMPLDEGLDLRRACRDAGLGIAMLAGPRTPDARLHAIADAADTFVYLAGHQGITGAAGDDDRMRRALVERVARTIRVRLCVGFGIRTRAQVDDVHAAGGAIAVTGSHLLRVLEHHVEQRSDVAVLLAAVADTFRELLPAPMREEN